MTLVETPRRDHHLDHHLDDEPPVTSSPPAPRGARSPFRLAARLAWRETRRRPGRTALVMLLVMVPVIGMTIASIAVRSEAAAGLDPLGGAAGRADLIVFHHHDRTGEVASALEGAGRVVTMLQTWTRISGTVEDGPRSVFVQLSEAPLDDPLLDSTIEFDAGGPPTAPNEVFLSRDVAETFGVTVGDVLRLDEPEIAWTVTGIGRSAANFSSPLVVLGSIDPSTIVTDYRTMVSLVELDPSFTTAEERRLLVEIAGEGIWSESRRLPRDGSTPGEVDARSVAWGWVAGVVALIAVGIVITAAFATSARRQLQTVGQLSANGAPEGVIRRSLALQGWWTGLLGAVAGIGAGVGIVLVSWPLFERTLDRRLPTTVIEPLDLTVIVLTATLAATVAALVPARSAARIPVLAALAGRRPLGDPPRWTAPVGIGSFLLGLALLAVASNASAAGGSGDAVSVVAVLGALCVLVGVVCTSPLVVHAVGRAGGRMGGTVRLAARSLAGTRTRSAAVITAITVVMAVAVAGLTGVAAERVSRTTVDTPLNRVTLTFVHDVFVDAPVDSRSDVRIDPVAVEPEPVPTSLRAALDAILPDAEWTEVQTVAFDPAPYGADEPVPPIDSIVVATADVVELLDLDGDQRAMLDATGAVPLVRGWPIELRAEIDGGIQTFDLGSLPAAETELETPWNPVALPALAAVTPDWLAEAGLAAATTTWIAENPVDLDDADRESLRTLSERFSPWGPDSAFVGDRQPAAGVQTFWVVNWYWPDVVSPWALIHAVVLGAALLLVLLVVAIGLALAATDGRSERDVLHAVGAPPGTLRRLAAGKAWTMTFAAALVAVPVGYSTMAVMSNALDRSAPFPWLTAWIVLVVIPLAAAAVAWAGSAVGQRVRPVAASRMSAA